MILDEIRATLLDRAHIRRRYTYTDREAKGFITRFEAVNVVAENLPCLHSITRDPDDDMIIACAVAANADYVVSRDRDLLDVKAYQGIQMASPERFIAFLRRI